MAEILNEKDIVNILATTNNVNDFITDMLDDVNEQYLYYKKLKTIYTLLKDVKPVDIKNLKDVLHNLCVYYKLEEE